MNELWQLALVFLKIGLVIFGGGYVMIPFVQVEVVNNHGWLTQREFVDAIALGQMTPGPIIIAAAFVGYKVAGFVGALVASLSLFSPPFILMVLATRQLGKFRGNRYVRAFLGGVGPAVVGMLLAASYSIGQNTIAEWPGVVIAVACFAILFRFKVSPAFVLLGAGVAGLVLL